MTTPRKPQRVSLAERNRLAIAGDETSPQTTPAAAVEGDPAPPAVEPAGEPSSTDVPEPVAGLSRTDRLGIYFLEGEFDVAKSAYLSDWLAGGHADSFARWIGQAIEKHASRTTEERALIQASRTARPGQKASKPGARSFAIPEAALERMGEATKADQLAGLWLTSSSFAAEAIAAAVDEAEKREGGALPPPPARLPNRLKR